VRGRPFKFESEGSTNKQLLHANNNYNPNNYDNNYYSSRSSNRSQGHELNSRSTNSNLKDNEQKSRRYEIDFLLEDVNYKTPTTPNFELSSSSSHIVQLRLTFK